MNRIHWPPLSSVLNPTLLLQNQHSVWKSIKKIANSQNWNFTNFWSFFCDLICRFFLKSWISWKWELFWWFFKALLISALFHICMLEITKIGYFRYSNYTISMYIIFKMLKDFSFGLFLQFFHNYERNERTSKKRAFFSPIFCATFTISSMDYLLLLC